MSYYRHKRWVFLAFAVSILFLCYIVDRSNFAQVVLGYAVAFYAYYFWTESEHFRSFKSILSQALIMRLLLLIAYPKLSDDYFRFIWDGLIQCQGIDPYAMLPSAVGEGTAYMQGLLADMNSPDYYSVYPPVMQWIFHGVSAIVGENTLGHLVGYRLVLILADVGVIWIAAKILKLMKKPVSLVALYALNPLVIVELIGNLHFEGLMLFFILSGIYCLMRYLKESKLWALPAGSLLIASGVLTKLTLFLALPAMWRRWGALRTMLVAVLTLGLIGSMASYYLDMESIRNIGQSLDLYFRNFQFNSSLFNLTLNTASHWIPHYTVETVGPWISAAMLLSIILIAVLRKANDFEGFFETLLFILSVHLLFASTVHPWYIINLVAVAMFSRYRYPMVWSFVAVISYFMYANDLVEVPWMIAIEYLLVLGYFLWERRELSRPV